MSGESQGGISSAMFALVFAVCFGAVGAGASWLMGSTLLEGFQARDWVRVKADVLSYGGGKILYRYRVGERDYQGDKLGPGPLSGGEIDDALDSRLSTAQAEKKPITVFVDPDDPGRSVADPEIPWQLVLFATPFAVAFGGVGLGALVVAIKLLFGGVAAKPKTQVEVAGTGAGFLWVFSIFWNSLAFPIALLAVPELVRDGEWLGLLVLIFPLVGVLLLWAALAASWRVIRHGRVEFHLQDPEPKLGSVVSGFLRGRRFKEGETYRLRLACVTEGENGALADHWTQDRTVRVAQGPQGVRLAFSFDTPERLPAAAGERDENTAWQLRVFGEAQPNTSLHTFRFEMLPRAGAAMVDIADEEPLADFDEEPVPAGIPKGLEGIAAFVGTERVQERIASMSAAERAQLHAKFGQLTEGQKQALEKIGQYAHYKPLIKKLVIAAIVLFFLVQMAGVVSVFLLSD